MSLEFKDGKISGSSGVAKAGLTLGIIGTGLSVLNGNLGNILGNVGWGFGNNRGNTVAEIEQSTIAALESQIAELKSMRYTDYVGMDLYKNIIAASKEEDEKISNVQSQLFGFAIDLDKRTALNEQAARLNREYDTAARDYMFTILNNKIDCCCDKMNMTTAFNQQINSLADASLLSYVNSTFVPGQLKLPITSICPEPATTTA
jgi:hypothetical protein